MNKSFIKSGLVVIAALVLASCSKTEEFQHNPDSALQIESVGGISPFALTTKAVITGNTLPGSDAATGIGIFVTASDGSAYDGHNKGYTNVNFANSGSGWSTSTPVYLSDTQGKLYGYFPYNSNANDLRAVPVASSLNGTDYLYAEPQTVSHSNKSVSLQMNHALSRLHLTIKKGENFTAEAPLSKITLKSTAIDVTGTMDLTTGAITATKKSGETGTVELTTDGTITAEGIEKDILLVPADNSNGKKGISISLMIAGKPAGITLSGENAIDIRSGIQNNVTLTIEDTGIKVSGVDVGVWGDGGSQQVQVGRHTVTVKFAEEQMPNLANDLIITSKVTEEGKAIVEAISRSQKRLGCYLDGEASCAKGTNTLVYYQPIGSVPPIIFISYVFTISDISSDITATIGYPRPESINLSSSSFTTYAGCSFKLSATVLPDDAVNKNFTWSSSNPSVATVDEDGKVTTKAEGVADITATTEVGGVTATCKVNVETYEPIFPTILPGKFSVASGKKVSFSRGNLRYAPSLGFWAWGVFNNQYEQGHNQDQLSLFTWGYGSWSTDWKTTSYESGNFTDWGTKIGDGNTWRTLTKDEWDYLLGDEGRTDAANKFGYATVCGMHGLLLLPDEFNDPKTNESTSQACVEKKFVPQSSKGWEQNIYSQGDSWDKMQAAGAVFLPAAGYRNGSDISSVGDYGYYWSSTPEDGQYFAYYLMFKSDNFVPASSSSRYNGYAVRLVTDVK